MFTNSRFAALYPPRPSKTTRETRRRTPIGLWDSGTAVTARSGDTLQTLASQLHLPLWSLTQINKWPEKASLLAGQRVVVPRHVAERVPDLPPAPSRR